MRGPVFFLVLFLCTAAAAQATPQQPPAASQPPPAAPGAAPAAAEPPKIDPEKEACIHQLLEVAGTPAMMHDLMQQISKTEKPLILNALPPGEYRAQLVDLFLERLESRISSEMLNQIAIPIYDKNFTVDEMKGLIQFYQTPLGQKAVSIMPKMTAEMFQKGAEMGQRIGRESMIEVLKEHPELSAALEAAYAASRPAPGGVPSGMSGGVMGGVLPPNPDGPQRIRVAAGVQEAKIISRAQPEYPLLARQARIEGTVRLHAIIGTDGTVTQLEVVSGPPLLVQAAVTAVRQWRYQPTLLSDKPVEVESCIDVIFTLGGKPPQPQ